MKKIFLLSFLIFSTNLFTQNLRLTDYTQNYYSLKSEAKVYLDSIHSLTPDSIFYHEGSEYSQFQQWQDFWEPRLFPHGDFNLYFSKLEESFRSNSTRSTYNANWLEIGPTDEPSGTMAANGGQSAGIGPIEFIKFYKSDLQNMLCGSIKGGLFYSNDGGENWTNAGSDTWQGNSSAVTWAEFKVDDSEVVYVSSGYQTDNEPGSIGGWGGIYRTQKNGIINANSQWDLIADYSSLGVTPNCKIKKILTDPSNSDILFVVTNEGLFKSTNVNSTTPAWAPLLIDDVFDLEMYPGNSSILYASFSGANSNVVKYSTDGGSTWLNLPSIPIYSSSLIRHISIEVSDAFPDNIYLYFYGFSFSNKDLYRYDYTLQTYSQINLTAIDNGTLVYGNGTAFGVSQSGIDEVIFIADIDRYSRYYNGVQTIFTSGSANFLDYHVDMEGFTFNPNNANEIWMASHGGPYKSIDQGDVWQSKMKGVGVAQVTSIADSYTNPESVLMSLYHDGAVLTSSPYNDFWNPSWKYVAGEDSYRSLIDSKDPSYMYTFGSLSWQSSNGSSAIPFATLGIYNETPAAINKVETNFFYGRGSPGINNLEILRSATHGTNPVSKISNISGLVGIPNGCSHVGAIFTFENQKDLLIVAFAGDEQNSNSAAPCYNPTPNNTLRLYYTLNATDPLIDPVNDWKFIDLENNGGRNNSWIRDVEMDELNPTTIYVSFNPNWGNPTPQVIYKVENFTSTTPIVTDITYNLPFTGITSYGLSIEKGSDGGLYVSTDVGVFYTNNKLIATDPLNAWILFGTNYPHLTSVGIEINYKINKIRSGVHGRGAWEADLYCPPDLNYTESGIYSINKFLEAQNTINSTAEVPSGLNVNYRSGDEIIMLPGFVANSGSDFRAFIHPCNQPGNSFKSKNENGIFVEEEKNTITEAKFNFNVVNPASNNLVLFFNNDCIGKEADIFIVNMMGQTVIQNKKFIEKRIELSCDAIKSGVYEIKVCFKNDCNSKKIIFIR